MRGFWLLVHVAGFSLWLGAGAASMLAGMTARQFPPAERLAAYRLSGRVHSLLVGPGVVLTLFSGLLLVRPFMSADMTGGLAIMLLAGLIAGLVTLFISLPTAQRLARLELHASGELPPSFRALRARQAVAGAIAGGLAILALLGGTVWRH